MRGNIIYVRPVVNHTVTVGTLVQYDYGQKLIIQGIALPEAYEVNFSNSEIGNSVTMIGTAEGVDIPDAMLETGSDIHCWIFLHDGIADGETEYHFVIKVKRRAQFENIEPTPAQRDVITQAIAVLNTAVGEAQASEAAAEAYADEAEQAAAQAEAAKVAVAESASQAAGSAAAAAESVAQIAGYAQDAADAATAAAGSKTAAAGSATAAAESATSAGQSATAAQQSADSAAQTLSQAVTTINTTKDQAVTAVNSTKDQAVTAVNTAKNEATTAITNAKNQAVTAVGNKGQEVLDSIPSDYSALSGEVVGLKSALFNNFNNILNGDVVFEIVNGEYINASTGAFLSSSGYSRSGFIEIPSGADKLYYDSGTGTPYNCFYDTNKDRLSGNDGKFTIVSGANKSVNVPTGAKYFAFSCESEYITTIKFHFYDATFYDPQITFDEAESFDGQEYPLSDDYKCFFVFADDMNITQYGKTYKKTLSDISTDTGRSLYRSFSGIPDCMYLSNDEGLYYDPKTDKFIISKKPINGAILIVKCEQGVMGGVLGNYYHHKNNAHKNSYEAIPYPIRNAMEIKEAETMDAITDDKFVAIFSTDTHTSEALFEFRNTVQTLIADVKRELNVDAVIHGGDIILRGEGTRVDGKRVLFKSVGKIQDNSNVYYAVGNHDYNGYSLAPNDIQNTSWNLSHHDVYNCLGRHHRDDVVWGSKDGMYYYKDFEEYGIRMIVLNTSYLPETADAQGDMDYNSLTNEGIVQEQLEWLCSTALNLGNLDYHVLVVCHAPLYEHQYSAICYNMEQVQGVLKAFKNGTYFHAQRTYSGWQAIFDVDYEINFASQGGKHIIGVWSGHTHNDDYTVIEGIRYQTTCCGFADGGIPTYNPSWGSDVVVDGWTYCFDVAIIDTENKSVVLKRFGVGEDRNYIYS